MDDDSADRIVEDIDPRFGVKDQVEQNMADMNDEKQYRGGKGLTNAQEQAIKDRIGRAEGLKSRGWNSKNQSYVINKNGNYVPVEQHRDVFVERDGDRVFTKTPKGTIKKIDDKYLD